MRKTLIRDSHPVDANKIEGIRPANSTQKDLSFTSFFLIQHKTHLAATRLPGLMHFLAQHAQGHVTAQCHLCQLPILQEKKEILSPGSSSLHHLGPFGQPIFHSSTQLGDLKSNPISSSAIMCNAKSAHFLRTSAEKRERRREEGGGDVRIDERAESLTVRHYRQLLKRPPKSASNFGGSQRQPLDNTLPSQSTRAETLNTSYPHTSRLCPSHRLDVWGVLPKVLILSRFFP